MDLNFTLSDFHHLRFLLSKVMKGDYMVINKPARAGTLESSDIYITVQPNQGQGIETNWIVLC